MGLKNLQLAELRIIARPDRFGRYSYEMQDKDGFLAGARNMTTWQARNYFAGLTPFDESELPPVEFDP